MAGLTFTKHDPKKSKTFKACAATEAQAKKALEQQISTHADSLRDAFLKQVNADAAAFHKTPAGKPAILDCSKCK